MKWRSHKIHDNPIKDKKKKKNVNTDKSCQTNFTVFIYLYSRSKHSKKSIHFNFFSKKKKQVFDCRPACVSNAWGRVRVNDVNKRVGPSQKYSCQKCFCVSGEVGLYHVVRRVVYALFLFHRTPAASIYVWVGIHYPHHLSFFFTFTYTYLSWAGLTFSHKTPPHTHTHVIDNSRSTLFCIQITQAL